MKNILYIGSGNSSNLVKYLDLNNYYVVALNNAWRHFENKNLDCWIHSGDFPSEWRPKNKTKISREVSSPEYINSVIEIVSELGLKCNSPAHHVGYTMFFLGIYFIANEFKPDKISLIGFDHDYDPEKVKRWRDEGQPNPQNNFKKIGGETLKDSLNKTFKNNKSDSFYGHGTPDPLRLGEEHLISKFELLKNNFNKLGIDLVNLSSVKSEINTIKKENALPSHLGGHLYKTHIDEGSLLYLINRFEIKTMVDIGCGVGGMVDLAIKKGIDCVGVDGDFTLIRNKPSNYILHDFSKDSLKINKTDLAWSVEFLEHVEERFLPNIFSLLKNIKIVCCTANNGPGYHHVNRQNTQYWINKFENNGFEFLYKETEELKNSSTMTRDFIRKTGMIFRNKNKI